MQKILKKIFQSAWFYYAMLAVVLYFSVIPKASYYQRLNNLIDCSSYPIYYSIQQPRIELKNVLAMRKPIKYYKLLAKLHPRLARAHAMIGYGYYILKDYKLAARYYLKASEISPEYFWFYYNLGIIYFRLGDLDKAVLYFNKVLSHENINLFSGLEEDQNMPQDKREIFNKVSFLRSMQAYSDTRDFVKDITQDPAHSQVAEDLILDPMVYLFPIGQEGL